MERNADHSLSTDVRRTPDGIVDGLTDNQDELGFIFDRAAQYFYLLSEPARLRIIQAVCTEERSVQDVVELTSLPQPNVSRHLSMLYRAGVLSRRREGTFVFYKISDPMITELCRTVCVKLAAN
ncbi:MAG: ArsR/SmtB family transcription factor [Burkholderiaceae bacterium]